MSADSLPDEVPRMGLSPFAKVCVTVAAAVVTAGTGPVWAANGAPDVWDGQNFHRSVHLNALVGQRRLASDDWSPTETQLEGGLDLDYTGYGWPVGWVVTALHSRADETDSGVDVSVRTYELQGGLRKVWRNLRWIHPYLGGGPTWVRVDRKRDERTSTTESSRYGLGGWVGAGAYVSFFDRITVGADARWSRVKVEVNDDEVDAGGWHAGVFLGCHWGEE